MSRDAGHDERIDAYIAKAAPFARPILESVRTQVHGIIPEVEESSNGALLPFSSMARF